MKAFESETLGNIAATKPWYCKAVAPRDLPLEVVKIKLDGLKMEKEKKRELKKQMKELKK